MDENVAGEDLAVDLLFNAILSLNGRLHRNSDLKDLVLQVSVLDGLLDIDFYFILIAGICVRHIPLGFRAGICHLNISCQRP